MPPDITHEPPFAPPPPDDGERQSGQTDGEPQDLIALFRELALQDDELLKARFKALTKAERKCLKVLLGAL